MGNRSEPGHRTGSPPYSKLIAYCRWARVYRLSRSRVVTTMCLDGLSRSRPSTVGTTTSEGALRGEGARPAVHSDHLPKESLYFGVHFGVHLDVSQTDDGRSQERRPQGDHAHLSRWHHEPLRVPGAHLTRTRTDPADSTFGATCPWEAPRRDARLRRPRRHPLDHLRST